jgi:hypothetical protein
MPSYLTVKHRNPEGQWVVTEFLLMDPNQPESIRISSQLTLQEHSTLIQGLSSQSKEVLEQLLLDGYQASYQGAYVAASRLG